MMDIEEIVKRLKKDTDNCSDITYRIKFVNNKKVYVIYNEPLTGGDKISDFIMRSLDYINVKYDNDIDLINTIINDISNFKVKTVNKYQDICYYLNYGFTVILIEGSVKGLVLETKRNLARGITAPTTESSVRGAMDSFVEDFQTNMGLIRRRIKDNNLWVKDNEVGRYTKTKVAIIYIKGICSDDLVRRVDSLIKKIDIDGITDSGTIKNLIEKENKSVFPRIASTERPDKVCQALLGGKVVIMVDTSPFCLILPSNFNDFFLNNEDSFMTSINISLTRIIRYVAFFTSMLMPAIYIAITTFNQEMLPTELLINFAAQRDSVPFSAFFEALIMMESFEILRESDLRKPNFASSALSIVGALILGEAAVNAGIVSPIMIIVIAITAISALAFSDPEIINGLRWYRLLYMIGAAFLGMVGVVMVFIYFILKMTSVESFGIPYMTPFAPTDIEGLKNSIIKFPTKLLNKRKRYLSDNVVKLVENGDDNG
jgi:spore germination protein KA